MTGPLYTLAACKQARRYVLSVRKIASQKVLMRRTARRCEKAAVRGGEYELICRGQTERDVS